MERKLYKRDQLIKQKDELVFKEKEK